MSDPEDSSILSDRVDEVHALLQVIRRSPLELNFADGALELLMCDGVLLTNEKEKS